SLVLREAGTYQVNLDGLLKHRVKPRLQFGALASHGIRPGELGHGLTNRRTGSRRQQLSCIGGADTGEHLPGEDWIKPVGKIDVEGERNAVRRERHRPLRVAGCRGRRALWWRRIVQRASR